MPENIVSLENLDTALQKELNQLIQILPARHQEDGDLRRLLAFRLKLDGFNPTRSYIVRKLREMNACGFGGRMYDYLKDDQGKNSCSDKNPMFADKIP